MSNIYYANIINPNILQSTVLDPVSNPMASNLDLGINQIAIAGGVSANSGLRSELNRIGEFKKWKTFIPKFEFCTDNAAMIAITGYFMYEKKIFSDQSVTAKSRMKF